MKRLVIILISILAVIVFLAINSCNTAKHNAKVLDKAYNRVSLDSNAREKLWRLVNSYKPKNDTSTKYIKGGTDTVTITVEKPVFDSAKLKEIEKQLIDAYSNCDDAVMATFNTVTDYWKKVIDTLKIKVPIQRPDTAKTTIFENAKYESQVEQTNSWHNRASYLEGFSEHQKQTIDDRDKTIRNLYLTIAGLVAVMIIYVSIRLYIKFHKP